MARLNTRLREREQSSSVKVWIGSKAARARKIGRGGIGVEWNNRLTISRGILRVGVVVVIAGYYWPPSKRIHDSRGVGVGSILSGTDDRPDNSEIRNLNWPFRLRRAGVVAG